MSVILVALDCNTKKKDLQIYGVECNDMAEVPWSTNTWRDKVYCDKRDLHTPRPKHCMQACIDLLNHFGLIDAASTSAEKWLGGAVVFLQD